MERQNMEKRADQPWSVGRLAVLLYFFAAGAVAINLFMLGLLSQWVGLTALTPQQCLMLAVPLGVPAAWVAGRWARHLLDEAAEIDQD